MCMIWARSYVSGMETACISGWCGGSLFVMPRTMRHVCKGRRFVKHQNRANINFNENVRQNTISPSLLSVGLKVIWTTRAEYNSYPVQLISKATRTPDNSYPSTHLYLLFTPKWQQPSTGLDDGLALGVGVWVGVEVGVGCVGWGGVGVQVGWGMSWQYAI